MRTINVAFVGFGNVGQALARLLLGKGEELQRQYNLGVRVTGIATKRHGIALDPDGINLTEALQLLRQGKSLEELSRAHCSGIEDLLKGSHAEVLFESIPVNYQDGQPALDILKQALSYGMHVITANKGPVVHGYAELTRIAEKSGCQFLFESTVMDGTPIFSLFRYGLPGVKLQRVLGILNSTTNFILTRMEQGERFEQAIEAAQEIGITETDPSGDIDGWDSAIKLAILATVLMEFPLKPQEVERTGIRDLTEGQVQRALEQGQRWKLVCRAWRDGSKVHAKVAPELVRPASPLYYVNGTSSMVQFETDMLGELTLLEQDPSPETTAYGLFADFIRAVCSV